VDVRVTFVSGNSVYLDRGRGAGIEVGDRVLIETPSGAKVEARIIVVATTTSRAEFAEGQEVPAPGSHGTVLVPANRAGAAPVVEKPEGSRPVSEAGDVPEHPPWTRTLEDEGTDTPLLAPAFHRSPLERPTDVRGRIFTSLLYDIDRGGDRDNTYALVELGADISVDNPFKHGGLLEFTGLIRRRQTDIGGENDEVISDGRIDRLYYRWGGGMDAPLQMQFGRFLPLDTPELGLIDGIEGNLSLEGAGRVGLNFGFMPVPFPSRDTLDDFGVTLSWRWAESEAERLVLSFAGHQSWHDGERDRSLLIGRFAYRPERTLSLTGSAWVDYYDSSDEVKSPGLELTEAYLYGTWNYLPGHGVRLSYSFTRWPELKRLEFRPVAAERLRDNRVSRVSLFIWQDLMEHLKLDGRVGYWTDQDDDGVTGDLTLRTPNLLVDGLDLSGTVFRTDGSYSEGHGYRLTARQGLPSAAISLSYEQLNSDLRHTGGSNTLNTRGLTLNLDYFPASRWSFSLDLDYRFGDSQDALGLGLVAQYRF